MENKINKKIKMYSQQCGQIGHSRLLDDDNVGLTFSPHSAGFWELQSIGFFFFKTKINKQLRFYVRLCRLEIYDQLLLLVSVPYMEGVRKISISLNDTDVWGPDK